MKTTETRTTDIDKERRQLFFINNYLKIHALKQKALDLMSKYSDEMNKLREPYIIMYRKYIDECVDYIKRYEPKELYDLMVYLYQDKTAYPPGYEVNDKYPYGNLPQCRDAYNSILEDFNIIPNSKWICSKKRYRLRDYPGA